MQTPWQTLIKSFGLITFYVITDIDLELISVKIILRSYNRWVYLRAK